MGPAGVGVGGTGVAVGGDGVGVGPQAYSAAPAPSRAESRKNSRRDRLSRLSESKLLFLIISLLFSVRFPS